MKGRSIAFRAVAVLTACIALVTAPAQAAVIFSDDFSTDGSNSPPWGNQRGDWSASGGVYNAAFPDNSPITYSSVVGLNLTDFSMQVDANYVSDGGVWLRSGYNGGSINGVLLVLGGLGFGSGATGGDAGQALYWHVVTNGSFSSVLALSTSVFTPGENATIRVDVVGNRYDAYVDGVLKSTLIDNTFTQGEVGLYDFYTSLTFDNVVVSTVPEPSSLVLFCSGGAVGLIALGRRRKRAAGN
jgi:hypothetical protein